MVRGNCLPFERPDLGPRPASAGRLTALFSLWTLSLRFAVVNRVLLFLTLTRPPTTNVDIAIVRISRELVATPLQLPIQFVPHEVSTAMAIEGRLAASLPPPDSRPGPDP